MSGLNVLIVDDEPAIRQVLTAAVRKAGYSADTAASAGEASAKLAKGDFDVVLSDIFMPVMDGIELLKHTRTQGIDVPFIMITGFASVDSAIVAIKAGAYDYITKPVHQEEIVHRLAQIEALGGLKAENKAAAARPRGVRPAVQIHLAIDGRGGPADHPRRADRQHGADHRRVGHRQGPDRPADPRPVAARGRPLHPGQLQCHSRESSRK
jgi:CheY-like chemotaxis protein